MLWTTLLLASLLALGGCNDDDTDSQDPTSTGDDPDDHATAQPEYAAVATVASDFSSGAHALIETAAPFTAQTELSPTVSDITLGCRDDAIYRVARFQQDSIARFPISAPATADWQYSTLDDPQDPTSSNPRALIFKDADTAYLLRYGKTTAWIVDPGATAAEDFKTGELDLSRYTTDLLDGNGEPTDPDGLPEMQTGIIVDDKLFVVLQRLNQQDGFKPLKAFVAVFDTETQEAIETGMHPDVPGIELPIRNPSDIQYSAALDRVMIQGVGRYGSGDRSPEYSGGIAAIDPDTYATTLRVDDGDAENHPVGQISGFQLVDRNTGYLIGYAGFMDTALYAFDPETGEIQRDTNRNPISVAGIQGADIRDLAVDGQGRLWMSRGDGPEPGITILDPTTNTIIEERIPTALIPTTIDFCDTE
jgi:hypothetical protein